MTLYVDTVYGQQFFTKKMSPSIGNFHLECPQNLPNLRQQYLKALVCWSGGDQSSIQMPLGWNWKYGVVEAEQRQYFKDRPTMKTGVVTVKMK